ncbi:MAG: hypothetical protein CBC48_02970 [bacterium TMED88]|nr:hypothetical protein [Deltaproteobacteria bacterium]OUV35892.1 MAG: hypothetical protein CBC48_02970 [bacterium TMED88]
MKNRRHEDDRTLELGPPPSDSRERRVPSRPCHGSATGSRFRAVERLLQVGARSLSDAEILSLVLRTRASGRGALTVAQNLLDEAGGLQALASSPLNALISMSGLGPSTAASLLAAAEMGCRIRRFRLSPGDCIRSPRDICDHFDELLRGTRREHVMVLLLDGRRRVLAESQVSQGTLTSSLVHPREVFRLAVRAAAAALVVVHNHPSGDPRPSEEDFTVTRRLVEAGELIGIRVIDHVVVAAEGYFSFAENGEINQ